MGFFDAFFKEHQRTKSEEIYDKALQIFNSPELQNQALSGKLADKVTHGEDCDIIPGSYGRFGHDRTNPIPVNGPSGEFVYLSRLRLRRTGSMVFFHKAGFTIKIRSHLIASFRLFYTSRGIRFQ